MLTFKKALVLSLACLTLFFMFKSHHTSSTTPNFKNAHDMPRPTAWVNPADRERNEKAAKLAAEKAAKEAAAKAEKSFDAPEAPQKKPRTQYSLDELRKRPLKEQLEYQFPYNVDAKTPAYIWQTWKHTPAQGDFEEMFREPRSQLEYSSSQLCP